MAYFHKLISIALKSSLEIGSAKTSNYFFDFIMHEDEVQIGNSTFLVALICNPQLHEKKDKPSGLVFQDLSYLQVKEILFYDVETGELFSFEYSYHYGIWDYNKQFEKYYFRYDRDILLKNPPKKEIEHLHVKSDKPHFNSAFLNFEKIIKFLEDNWDTQKGCLELD